MSAESMRPVVDIAEATSSASSQLACLRALEEKVLWLAVWTIHHANLISPKRDHLKVGGHQASSASVDGADDGVVFRHPHTAGPHRGEASCRTGHARHHVSDGAAKPRHALERFRGSRRR